VEDFQNMFQVTRQPLPVTLLANLFPPPSAVGVSIRHRRRPLVAEFAQFDFPHAHSFAFAAGSTCYFSPLPRHQHFALTLMLPDYKLHPPSSCLQFDHLADPGWTRPVALIEDFPLAGTLEIPRLDTRFHALMHDRLLSAFDSTRRLLIVFRVVVVLIVVETIQRAKHSVARLTVIPTGQILRQEFTARSAGLRVVHPHSLLSSGAAALKATQSDAFTLRGTASHQRAVSQAAQGQSLQDMQVQSPIGL
jgi:hypothetical protein